MIVILDYGMGNMGSHVNMMRKVGCGNVIASSKISDLENAEKIIIPGVGAFNTGMENLKNLGIIKILNHKILEEKIPVLGICLGMHLFANESDEGNIKGLGWVDSKVVRFNFIDFDRSINGNKPQGKPSALFPGASPGELNHNFASAEALREGGL